MEFTLSLEQALLKESANRFAKETLGFAGRAARRDKAAVQWRKFCDMGWIAAGIAPERGGFGGVVEMALIAQELGQVLAIEPYLGCGVLAPQLLLAASGTAHVESDALLAAVCAGETRAAAAVSEPEGRGGSRLGWHACQIGARLCPHR